MAIIESQGARHQQGTSKDTQTIQERSISPNPLREKHACDTFLWAHSASHACRNAINAQHRNEGGAVAVRESRTRRARHSADLLSSREGRHEEANRREVRPKSNGGVHDPMKPDNPPGSGLHSARRSSQWRPLANGDHVRSCLLTVHQLDVSDFGRLAEVKGKPIPHPRRTRLWF